MSLTRKALDECLKQAIEDIESAPANGMLTYLIESRNENPDSFIRREQEIVAMAFYRAMVIYTRA
jgi:hypothetical protein